MKLTSVLGIVAAVCLLLSPVLIVIGVNAQLASARVQQTRHELCDGRSGYIGYMKRRIDNDRDSAPRLFDGEERAYVQRSRDIEQDELDRIQRLYDETCAKNVQRGDDP